MTTSPQRELYYDRLSRSFPGLGINDLDNNRSRIIKTGVKRFILGNPLTTVLPTAEFAKAVGFPESTLYRHIGRPLVENLEPEVMYQLEPRIIRRASELTAINRDQLPLAVKGIFFGITTVFEQNGISNDSVDFIRRIQMAQLQVSVALAWDARPSEVGEAVGEQFEVQAALDVANLVEPAEAELRRFLATA